MLVLRGSMVVMCANDVPFFFFLNVFDCSLLLVVSQYLSTDVATAVAQDRDLVVTLRGAGLLLPRAQVFPVCSDRALAPPAAAVAAANVSITSPSTNEDGATATAATAVEKHPRVSSSGGSVRMRSEEQRVWWRLSIEDPCACLGLGGGREEGSGQLEDGNSGSSGVSGSGGGGGGGDSGVVGVMTINESDQTDGDLGATLSLDTQLRTFRALERAAR